jgi:hypothetical protein
MFDGVKTTVNTDTINNVEKTSVLEAFTIAVLVT